MIPSRRFVQPHVADIEEKIGADHQDVRYVEPNGIGQRAGLSVGVELAEQADDIAGQNQQLKGDALALGGPGFQRLGDVEGPGAAEQAQHGDFTELGDGHTSFSPLLKVVERVVRRRRLTSRRGASPAPSAR